MLSDCGLRVARFSDERSVFDVICDHKEVVAADCRASV